MWSIHQNAIINVEASSFFNIKYTSFVVDLLEDVVNLIMHCSHSVDPFFCGARGQLVVMITVNDILIKAI